MGALGAGNPSAFARETAPGIDLVLDPSWLRDFGALDQGAFDRGAFDREGWLARIASCLGPPPFALIARLSHSALWSRPRSKKRSTTGGIHLSKLRAHQRPMDHVIRHPSELDELYPDPTERALIKVKSALEAPHRRFLEASPFFVLASCGSGGLDASPRGDPPGSLLVLDERTLAVGDRPGNRRVDSLRNLLDDPRVALLFLIPGLNESVRVNGRATITRDPELLERLRCEDQLPICALRIEIDEVFHQCSKALMRAQLWEPESRRSDVPRISDRPESDYLGTLY